MRNGNGGKAHKQFRSSRCRRPGKQRSPVLTGDVDRTSTELVDQGHHIADDLAGAVLSRPRGRAPFEYPRRSGAIVRWPVWFTSALT